MPTSQPLSAGVLDQLQPLIDPALSAIDRAIDLVGEDAVILYLQGRYDEYIAPLDIPYVPDSLEAVIDQVAKTAIGRLVRVAHAAIHKQTPPVPVPAPVVVPPTGAAQAGNAP